MRMEHVGKAEANLAPLLGLVLLLGRASLPPPPVLHRPPCAPMSPALVVH